MVGTNPELQAKYAALPHHIEEEKIKEAHLEKLVKQLKATGDPKGLLERVKASRQHAVQVWGQYLADKAGLEKEMVLASLPSWWSRWVLTFWAMAQHTK